jgi:hypothetical protein
MMDLLIRVLDKHFEIICWTVVIVLLTGASPVPSIILLGAPCYSVS